MKFKLRVRTLTYSLSFLGLLSSTAAIAQINNDVPQANGQPQPAGPVDNGAPRADGKPVVPKVPNPNVRAPNPAPVPQVIPRVVPEVHRPEPPPKEVPDSIKSADQKTFESTMQQKLDGLIARIKILEANIEKMPKKERKTARERLRTAQGNRSVTRTKMKQLKYITPNSWFTIRDGIEKSFENLIESVDLAEAAIPSPTDAKETSVSPE